MLHSAFFHKWDIEIKKIHRYYLRFVIVILLLSIITSLKSQTFTEKDMGLPGVNLSSVAWGDYNNDGYFDILLSGTTNGSSSGDLTDIYENNGDSTFTETGIALTDVYQGSVAWGDYNNDGYLDIFLCNSSVSKIYKNNGNNTFTEQTKISIPGLYYSSVAWGDYDNDGDLDILLTGRSGSDRVSKIYKNIDDTTFKEQTGIYLEPVDYSSVAWGDYDNDGYLDILLSGTTTGSYSGAKTIIYKNNGDNSFTEQTDISLTGVEEGSVAWGDYDNDGYLDILLTGQSSSYSRVSKIYKNNGDNTFTEQIDISLTGVENSSVAWGDYDNDGYLDILLSGTTNGSYSGVKTIIYKNNGDNSFTERTDLTLTGVYECSVAWGDYDNDDDLDILITGRSESSSRISKIYRNESSVANTVPASPTNIQNTVSGDQVTLSWDRSSDNETTPLGLSYNLIIDTISGGEGIKTPMANISTGFRKIVEKGIIQDTSWTIKNLDTKTYYWSVQTIDNYFSGSAFSSERSFSVTFKNSISPTDEQVLLPESDGTPLTVNETETSDSRQWKYSLFSGGPYNNEILGATGTSYTPNFSGGGIYYVVCVSTKGTASVTSNEVKVDASYFVELDDVTLPSVTYSSAAWGDYDNDGDIDVLLTGYVGFNNYISTIYKNNGDNTFSEQSGLTLTSVAYGSAAWGDCNNDGFLDILLTGIDISDNAVSEIYLNNGDSTFTELTDISLAGVYYSSVGWGDYDNDGDLDILITGNDGSDNGISKIYKNNGDSTFTEQTGISLEGVYYSSVAWGDYDSDGDLDILLTGYSNSGRNSKIYKNNGDNTFTEQTEISIADICYSSVAWGDYNNDGYLDILLTGIDASYDRISKIYKNNGDNTFTEQTQISLESVAYGSIAWGDYNNDGNLDILLTGSDENSNVISKIYCNNGDNSFTEKTEIDLDDVANSSVAWGDCDSDGDLDILLIGNYIAKIYKSNAPVSNTAPGTPQYILTTVSGNQVTFSWDQPIDNEIPQKAISYNLRIDTLSGGIGVKSPMANVSTGFRKIGKIGEIQENFWTIQNLDTGKYYWSVQAIDNNFLGSAFATEDSFAISFSNSISPKDDQIIQPGVDGTPLVVSESEVVDARQWKYSIIPGGPYSELEGDTGTTYTPNLPNGGTYYIVCVSTKGSISVTSNEVIIDAPYFTEQTDISIKDVVSSSVAWGDYDNDNDLDILLTGYNLGYITKIFKNNNDGTFSEQTGLSLTGVYNGSVAWGDYDNDNDLDILLTGREGSNYISKIYKNNGDSTFTELTSANLTGVYYSSVAWGDYDNDGDLDILLTGNDGSNNISKIYKNNGDSTFAEQTGISLPGLCYSSVAWGDYDNDGDLDILLTGYYNYSRISKIYKNIGYNSFTEQTSISLEGVYKSSVAWGDYDNDGNLDILLTGFDASDNCISKIYKNNGNNSFTEQTNISLEGVASGSVAWGDYDNDGDLDILLSGENNEENYVSKIYKNINDTTFTEQTSISLTGVYTSSVAWGDYDNDGDLDILLTGDEDDYTYTSKIYKNNSSVFNTIPSSPSNIQSEVGGNSVSLNWNMSSDSETPQSGITYNLYIDTLPGGSGIITPMSDISSGFRKIAKKGKIQYTSWFINNLDTGKYYWSVQAVDNNYSGSTFATEDSFFITLSNSISPTDDQFLQPNVDGTPLVVTETEIVESRQWKYSLTSGGPYNYELDGDTGTTYVPNFSGGNTYYVVCVSTKGSESVTSNEVKIDAPYFVEQTDISLKEVYNSSVAWGDYDNDNDLDILLTGYDAGYNANSKIYKNKGDNTFTEQTGLTLTGVYNSCAEWGDYNNDGYLDILLTGQINFSTRISKIYTNNGDSTFTEQTSIALEAVNYGSSAWGDYNNDGNLDILLTGSSSSGFVSIIYKNNGDSTFTEQTGISIEGVRYSSVDWGDYDNDGDLDILLTGENNSYKKTTKVYNNNGDNTFTEQTNISLEGVASGSIAWGDYDNDGDLDILLTGSDVNSNPISKVYKNNGDKTFTEQTNISLEGVASGSIAWGDYDCDGDLDILLTGNRGSFDYISKIYKNNGDNTFTEQTGILLDDVGYNNSVAWGDYDSDGDLDILLTGNSSSGIDSKIYKNNNFITNTTPNSPSLVQVEVNGTSATFIWERSIDNETPQIALSYNLQIDTVPGGNGINTAMADISTGYRWIVESGKIKDTTWTIHNLDTGKYYWSVQSIDNNFSGSLFTEVDSFTITFKNSISPIDEQIIQPEQDGIQLSVVETETADSWQWKYALTSGGPYIYEIIGETETTYIPNFEDGGTYYIVCVSTKESESVTSNEVKIDAPYFIEQTGVSLTGVSGNSSAWGDYDNDGDLDILLMGSYSSIGISKIYKNKGDNTFTEQTGVPLLGVQYGSAAWGDYNNDGYLDILLTGYRSSGNISKIYKNNGDSTFSELTGTSIPGVRYSSVAWGDYDNNGNLDILLTGNVGVTNITKIYKNNGDSTFTEQTGISLKGVMYGSAVWGDYDNDGNLDILITGQVATNNYISKIYKNNGDNTFSEQTGVSLPGVKGGTGVWGDYDNDGDLDILLTGDTASYSFISKIYKNNGDNTFTEQTDISLTGVSGSSANWMDYNNDGNLDILLSGNIDMYNRVSIIYKNNGDNTFSEQTSIILEEVSAGFAWGDYDNDNDLDILLTGHNGSEYISKIYKNNTFIANTLPNSPSIIQTTVEGNSATLNWGMASDNETPPIALSYNLYIDTISGGDGINTSMADIATGFRKSVEMGKIQDTLWTIHNLDSGKYYWSVQAIDNICAGSAFAAEDSFTITFTNRISPVDTQVLQPQIAGTLLTVIETETPDNRQWKYSYNTGGPYIHNIPGETEDTYIPNFEDGGIYYIVCVSTKGTDSVTSNEVMINVEYFTEQTGISLLGVYRGSVAWGDYDNDDDLDILLSGNSSSTKIYKNKGDNTFIEQGGTSLTGVYYSSVAWGDYNNDGYLDILITGRDGSNNCISEVYTNNGDSTFTEQTSISLSGVYRGSVAWGDYNNDGDLDILLTGLNEFDNEISKIYKNNGDSTFTEQTGITLSGVGSSSVAWGDYNNDEYLDILLTGQDVMNNRISKIYKNNGNNSFTEQTGIVLTGVSHGSAAWGDYNNDGNLDILLTGSRGSDYVSKIYKNNGNNSFSELTGTKLVGVVYSSVAWGDYDNDSDLDILITGDTSVNTYTYVSKIYKNNGDGSFAEQIGITLTGVSYSSVDWGDYDNDNDLDILLTGQASSSNYISKIYKNNTPFENTIPESPSNLQADVSGNKVLLSWDKSSDVETPQQAISYAIYIDTISGGVGVNTPMANVTNGFRKIVAKGFINDTSWTIQNLNTGTYYWNVQAIDNICAGSVFATENSFTVTLSNSISPIDTQFLQPGVDGDTLFVTETETVDSRQWKCSTYPGGPYHDIEGETGTSYIPNIADGGIYYIVCVSTKDGASVTSNELIIDASYFSEQTDILLTGLYYSYSAWGDYDNDGDLDILITGSEVFNTGVTKIYKNNGNNSFTEQTDISLTGIYNGSAVWGDYDNDGDLDILLCGNTSAYYGITKIYKNNGDNSFTEQTNISLTDLANSSANWIDYDNDGDLDIIISGNYDYSNAVSKIYKNNGDGSFTEQTDNILPGVDNCSVAWGDYNNDGYPDVLISGYDFSGNSISKVYRNNGDGAFTNINANLTGLSYCSIAWGDYNNDAYLDILLTGLDGNDNVISKIYKNNGDETFSEQTDISLTGVDEGSVAWGDYDNDGDLDILLTGLDENDIKTSIIYKNNGDNTFDPDSNIIISDVAYGSVAWGDYDNDNDLDIMLSGRAIGNDICKIYQNNNSKPNTVPSAPNNLSSKIISANVILSWDKAMDMETPEDGLTYNVVVSTSPDDLEILSPMSDLNTGYRRLVTMGNVYHDTICIISQLDTVKYYWRVQSIDNSFAGSAFSELDSFTIQPLFTEIDANLTGLTKGSVNWGDYDNDGDLDILLTGKEQYLYHNVYPRAKIYRNEGNNVFTEQTYITLDGVINSSAAWGDYDNDGDLDILLCGSTDVFYGTGGISKIYNNNGNNTFTELAGISFSGVYNSSVAWGDYNNDGDLDILLTGYTSLNKAISKIYKNNGDSTFTEQTDISLIGINQGSAAWGDYDNDGYLDILLTGFDTTGNEASRIYRNDGNNIFIEQTEISLIDVASSSVAWGDYDNDGDLDILLTGISGSNNNSIIYKNNGDGTFTEQTNIFLRGISNGSVAWGDYDNDGDLDIVLTGDSRTYISLIYRNDGDDIFTELDYGLSGVWISSVAWGDYDSDSDLDILLSGADTNGTAVTKIYENIGNLKNNTPAKPSNLEMERIGYGVLLKWEAPNDDITPSEALTYNVRVGTSSDSFDIVSPMSDVVAGDLTVPLMGNCYLNMKFIIDSLPVGTYYWSVQAIDQAYQGGEWADEQQFNMTVLQSIIAADTVCFGDTTHFTDESFTAGESIIEWKWYFGDGDSSSLQNPVHYYLQSGSFDATLIIHSVENSDTTTQTVIVKHKPIADFSADEVCQGTPTTFTNNSFIDSVTVTSWLWDFNDGSTSSIQNPGTHGYLSAGSYDVKLEIIADNDCMDSITQSVNVGAIPVVSASSSRSLEFCSGDSTILSVAYNSNYIYQWQLDNVDITGADSNSYTPKNSGTYKVIVTNPIGNCQTTSNELIVNILEIPSALSITIGSSTTLCQGDSVILSVTDNPDYKYQWKQGGGAVGSSSTYNVKPPLGGTYFYTLDVELDTTNCIVPSPDTVEVIVYNNPVTPTIIPSTSDDICDGDSVILTISNNSAYTYQWKRGATILTGAVDTIYIAKTSGNYIVDVENSYGCVVTTAVEPVIVLPSPTSPSINVSGPTTFCKGDSIILGVTENPDYTYYWKLEGGETGTDTSKLKVKPYNDGTYTYNLIIENTNYCQINSVNTVVITVLPVADELEIISNDADNEICLGENIQLSVTNKANYIYIWKSDGGNIGTDSNIFIAQPTVSGTYQYSLDVEHASSGCITPAFNVVNITAYDNPTLPTVNITGETIICSGDSVVLNVTNNPAYTYQWKDGISIIQEANNSNYTALTSGKYNLKVENAEGCSVNTDSVSVTVYPSPVKPTINRNGDNRFCDGESVELSVTDDENYTYHWKNGEILLSDTDTSVYITSSTGNYLVEISNAYNCYVISDTMKITVLPSPISARIDTSSSTEFCDEDSVILSVTYNPDYTYQWKKGGGIIEGTYNNNYVVYEEGTYSLTILNSDLCESNSVNSIVVDVNQNPTSEIITVTPDKRQFCSDESISISIEGQDGYTYQWKEGGDNISGAMNNSYSNISSGSYSVVISNSDNCSVESQSVNITVDEKPTIPLIDLSSNTLDICPGEKVTIELENVSSNYNYQWKQGIRELRGETLPTLIRALEPGEYSVVASVGNCSSESDIVTVTYKESLPFPELEAFGPVVWYIACSNDSVLNYRWYYNGDLIPGEVESIYVAYQNLGEYYVEINDGGECYVPSESIMIPPDYTTGIDEENIFGTIKIYPNPTPGLFTIEIENNLYGELMIDINNEGGARIIMMEILKNNRYFKTNIDLSGQGKGLYFIGFKFDKNCTVRKLFIE